VQVPQNKRLAKEIEIEQQKKAKQIVFSQFLAIFEVQNERLSGHVRINPHVFDQSELATIFAYLTQLRLYIEERGRHRVSPVYRPERHPWLPTIAIALAFFGAVAFLVGCLNASSSIAKSFSPFNFPARVGCPSTSAFSLRASKGQSKKSRASYALIEWRPES
jgi:hypothetical protein